MAFTLNMKISGLCVLVPDGDTMQVLLPNTHGLGNPCHEHETRIYFDERYLTGSDQELTPPEDRLFDDFLNGSLLVGSDPPSVSVTIPREVLHITDCAIHEDCLAADGGGRLDARLTLLNGGMPDFAEGTCWHVPGQSTPQELTFQVLWVMEMEGDSLTWNVSPLNGASAPTLRELKPVDTIAGRLLEVEIIHGLRDEMPGNPKPEDPKPNTPPKHIAKCLPVVFQDFRMPDVLFSGKLGCCKSGYPTPSINEIDTTTTFSCMITAGDKP